MWDPDVGWLDNAEQPVLSPNETKEIFDGVRRHIAPIHGALLDRKLSTIRTINISALREADM
jgi:hypothetical protein